MRQMGTVLLVVLFVLLWLMNSGQTQPADHAGLVLFTAVEAELLRLTEEEWQYQPPRTRALLPGPRIVIEQPEVQGTGTQRTIATVTPIALVVRFEEHQASVDMSSLRVKAKKGFFSKSLTALFKPYVRGTTIRVEKVEVPQGKFHIEIAIADTNGMRTVETYRLHVSGG